MLRCLAQVGRKRTLQRRIIKVNCRRYEVSEHMDAFPKSCLSTLSGAMRFTSTESLPLAPRCCVYSASQDETSATTKTAQLLRRKVNSTADFSGYRGAIAELLRQCDETQLGNCGYAELRTTARVLFDAIHFSDRDAPCSWQSCANKE